MTNLLTKRASMALERIGRFQLPLKHRHPGSTPIIPGRSLVFLRFSLVPGISLAAGHCTESKSSATEAHPTRPHFATSLTNGLIRVQRAAQGADGARRTSRALALKGIKEIQGGLHESHGNCPRLLVKSSEKQEKEEVCDHLSCNTAADCIL